MRGNLRWIGLGIGGGLFLWILVSSDLSAVWQQVKSLKGQFFLIVLFYAVIFLLDTLGWRFAFYGRGKFPIRWDRLFRARLAGEAVNYVTPTAWIGGEPVKAILLSQRYGVPLPNGMASVVVAKTTFSLSMLLFILTGLGVTLFTQSKTSPLISRWIWMSLFLLMLLLVLFLALQFAHPFRRGAQILQRVVPKRFFPFLGKGGQWDDAITSFYLRSPRAVLFSLGFHFLGWVAGVVEVFLILKFLKVPVTLVTAWSIEALWVLFKSTTFLIPASLGASEGLALVIAVGMGLNAVSGLSLALVRRARELLWVGWGLLEFSRG